MPINYIPNDPGASAALPRRVISPRPDRPANRARYDIAGPFPEAQYNEGTPEFLYWQCREAVLAAAEAWEAIHGPFTSWQDDGILSVLPDEGEDLNAYYDRIRNGQPERISFFHQKVGAHTYFSGASTDVVAHEVGHALLDAIRPDFWTSFRFEVNSFHEAFGDCIAIVTALHDKRSRQAILSSVTSTNFVESTAEELAKGILKAFPRHNAGAPRRARNDFQWGPEGSINTNGGLGELIYEEHSFGQVFSGCFYDTILNIFNGMSSQSEGNLLRATQTAGALLVKAVQQAPQRSQYFREVGRLMVLIDEQENNAANRSAIQEAFQGHSVALGASAALAPQLRLAAAPKHSARGSANLPVMGGAAKRQLLKVIGAPSGKLVLSSVEIAGNAFQKAVHQRAVPLGHIHKKLKGVVAMAAQTALVGQTHNSLAIMGHVSNADVTIRDVESYVESLIKNGRINFESSASESPKSAVAGTAKTRSRLSPNVTHEVCEIRGEKMLSRIRFACSGI